MKTSNKSSINEVICHGIPDKRPLQNGDICNGKSLCEKKKREENKTKN